MNKLQRMAIKVHIPAIDKDSLSDYNKLEIQRFPKTSMRDFARGGNMWGLHLAVKAHAKEASKHEHQEVLTACLLGALESKHATGNALRLLVKAGAELKTDDHMMHVACGRTYLENLRFLADECKMLEQKDYSKIMYYASINGNIEVMEYLLKEKKASAEYFNDRHPVNFEDSANYLIKLLPLMEEAGFNFDLHKKCLLSSALYVNNDALIKHVWSRFTPHDKGALTMGAIPTDVAGGNVTIGDLLEKYGIEPEGYAMHKAYTAVKERDLDKLKKIIEEDNFDINARSRLLSLAFKQESTLLVKELYALGASFQKKSSEKILSHLITAARMESSCYLDDIEKHPESQEIFKDVMNKCIQHSSWEFQDYTRKVLKRVDLQPEELEKLFLTAVKAGNKEIIPDLIAAGYPLDTLESVKLYAVVEACPDLKILKALAKQGLDIAGHINPLVARHSSHNDTKDFAFYFQCIKQEERRNKYPYWEKQDDNTVAELSLVRRESGDKFLCLRRAFNFRAGVVDHNYEIHGNNSIEDFKPANTIAMSDFAAPFIAKAKQELESRGGNALSITQREEKPLRTFKSAAKANKPV